MLTLRLDRQHLEPVMAVYCKPLTALKVTSNGIKMIKMQHGLILFSSLMQFIYHVGVKMAMYNDFSFRGGWI